MKRAQSCNRSGASQEKKRKVSYATFEKWRRDFDREFKTVSWLECESAVEGGTKVVRKLKCSVCGKFRSSIIHKRNFSDRWITSGADSIRTSNIRDHATSEQHSHAMSLLSKEQAAAMGQSIVANAPIVVALNTMSADEKERTKNKFDIAYFMAMEQIAFHKFPGICELERRHGVNIGTNYTTETSTRSFTHFIAEAQRKKLVTGLQQAKFFSVLLDGSTDSRNIENELLLVVWFDKDGQANGERVVTRTSYLKIARPSTGTAKGIFDVLQTALQGLGISAISREECGKIVGIGTDGASANIAGAGLKGLVEKEIPWVVWMWCMAHRLELAIKDALKHTYFELVDDMLLRLYLLYESSPKKCRELEEIVMELRECLSIEDGGMRPVRASGSRWITHKWNAMKRVLSKYDAYTTHLASLSADPSVNSLDRAKLRGYYLKWTNAKYLLGCALFVDLLTPCSILSKVMQHDDLDILSVLTSLLRSVKEIEKLSSTSLDKWSTYAATLVKCTEKDGAIIYQSQDLKGFVEAKTYFSRNYKEYCSKVSDCLKSRLAWSDLQMLRDVILVLATQGWQKLRDENDSLEAIDRLVEHFSFPLLKANAKVEAIHSEFESMLEYACQYISLSTLEYRAVWWRLFHAPVSPEWGNALTLVELLFSLPSSNGMVERLFSQMKVAKTKKRSLLSNEALDDLLMITSARVPLREFSPDEAVDLWWIDRARRPNQKSRKPYRKHKRTRKVQDASTTASTSNYIEILSSDSEVAIQSESGSDSDESLNLLDEWDDWMESNDEADD